MCTNVNNFTRDLVQCQYRRETKNYFNIFRRFKIYLYVCIPNEKRNGSTNYVWSYFHSPVRDSLSLKKKKKKRKKIDVLLFTVILSLKI